MRADQRRSLHRTILTAAVLLLSASAVAAQTTYYGPGGDYLGQGTWRRNTATFYDAKGNFVGTSSTVGRSTSFFGRDGAFQGTLSRTGDSTNFYDRAGRYQGSVTTVPPPGSVGTRSKGGGQGKKRGRADHLVPPLRSWLTSVSAPSFPNHKLVRHSYERG